MLLIYLCSRASASVALSWLAASAATSPVWITSGCYVLGQEMTRGKRAFGALVMGARRASWRWVLKP
jgi:hypothetical protein